MQGKNRYFRRSRLSEAKLRVIIRSFALDFPASKDVSRPTINQLFLKLRIKVAQVCDASWPFSGEVEVDESYFGARRVRGKEGRGAGGKTIVFGILERQGKVYTEIVPDACRKQLQAAIRGQVALPWTAASTRTAGEPTMGCRIIFPNERMYYFDAGGGPNKIVSALSIGNHSAFLPATGFALEHGYLLLAAKSTHSADLIHIASRS